MIIPAILLLLILGGFAWMRITENESVPLKVLLAVMALVCVVWYLKSSVEEQPTSMKMEATRHRAIGHALGSVALERLAEGDEILLLVTSLPAWQSLSMEMAQGVDTALKTRKGISVREMDISELEGGNTVAVDGLLVMRGIADQVQGADAVIGAFPMMGDKLNPKIFPKLPPLYGYYDGQSPGWRLLVHKNYFRGLVTPMIWKEAEPDRELSELEQLFRREYILATPENLKEFGQL